MSIGKMKKPVFLKHFYKPDVVIKGKKIAYFQEIYDREFSLDSIKDGHAKHTGKYRLLVNQHPIDIVTLGRTIQDCVLVDGYIFIFIEYRHMKKMAVYMLDQDNKFIDQKIIHIRYLFALWHEYEFVEPNKFELSLEVFPLSLFQFFIFNKQYFFFSHILKCRKSSFLGIKRKTKIASSLRVKMKEQRRLSYIQLALTPKTEQNFKTVIGHVEDIDNLSIHFVDPIISPDSINMPPYYARDMRDILLRKLRVFDIGGMTFVFKENGGLVTINLLTNFLDKCKEEVFSIDFSAYSLVDLHFYELLKPDKVWLREEKNPEISFNAKQGIIKYRFKNRTQYTKTYALSDAILVSIDEDSCMVDLIVKHLPLTVHAVE